MIRSVKKVTPCDWSRPHFQRRLFRCRLSLKHQRIKINSKKGSSAYLKKTQPLLFSINEDTGQTLIAGMGELHLEIIRDRLFREFKVQAEAGRPQLPIEKPSGKLLREKDASFVNQLRCPSTGTPVLKLSHWSREAVFSVKEKLAEGVIPKEFIEPTLEGIREAAHNGVVAGYPVTDFKATLVDGSFHEVDSSELAFQDGWDACL